MRIQSWELFESVESKVLATQFSFLSRKESVRLNEHIRSILETHCNGFPMSSLTDEHILYKPKNSAIKYGIENVEKGKLKCVKLWYTVKNEYIQQSAINGTYKQSVKIGFKDSKVSKEYFDLFNGNITTYVQEYDQYKLFAIEEITRRYGLDAYDFVKLAYGYAHDSYYTNGIDEPAICRLMNLLFELEINKKLLKILQDDIKNVILTDVASADLVIDNHIRTMMITNQLRFDYNFDYDSEYRAIGKKHEGIDLYYGVNSGDILEVSMKNGVNYCLAQVYKNGDSIYLIQTKLDANIKSKGIIELLDKVGNPALKAVSPEYITSFQKVILRDGEFKTTNDYNRLSKDILDNVAWAIIINIEKILEDGNNITSIQDTRKQRITDRTGALYLANQTRMPKENMERYIEKMISKLTTDNVLELFPKFIPKMLSHQYIILASIDGFIKIRIPSLIALLNSTTDDKKDHYLKILKIDLQQILSKSIDYQYLYSDRIIDIKEAIYQINDEPINDPNRTKAQELITLIDDVLSFGKYLNNKISSDIKDIYSLEKNLIIIEQLKTIIERNDDLSYLLRALSIRNSIRNSTLGLLEIHLTEINEIRKEFEKVKMIIERLIS